VLVQVVAKLLHGALEAAFKICNSLHTWALDEHQQGVYLPSGCGAFMVVARRFQCSSPLQAQHLLALLCVASCEVVTELAWRLTSQCVMCGHTIPQGFVGWCQMLRPHVLDRRPKALFKMIVWRMILTTELSLFAKSRPCILGKRLCNQ
jgi:hypothetical protein